MIWGDQSGGRRFILLGTTVTVPDVGLFHDYRLDYVEGSYSVYVDAELLAGPTPRAVRPNNVWIGNPNVAGSALLNTWELR